MPYSPPFAVPQVPGIYLRFNNTFALGDPDVPHRAIVMGTRLPSGSVDQNVPKRVRSHDEARAFWGDGSMVAGMAMAFLDNSDVEIWGVGVDEDAGGAAATGSVTFTGSVTASGTLHLLVAGVLVRVPVLKDDAPADVVDKTLERLTETQSLPMTLADDGDSVDFTCRWKGLSGNAIDLRLDPDVTVPAGLSVVFTAMNGGASDPDVEASLAALGDDVKYDTVAIGYVDATNLDHLDAWLETRWGELVQLEGLAVAAHTGSFSDLTSLAAGLNSKFLVVEGPGPSPTPPWLWASAVASADAAQTMRQPNAPRLGMVLDRSIRPPAQQDRFSHEQRNTLLANGISTAKGTVNGTVALERVVTTYTTNGDGFPDSSYSDVGLMRTLHRLRYLLQVFRYRYKDWLISDDESMAGEPKVMTPIRMKNFLNAEYLRWKRLRLVHNTEFFQHHLQVGVAENKQDMVVFIPVDVIRGLNVIAGELAFV